MGQATKTPRKGKHKPAKPGASPPRRSGRCPICRRLFSETTGPTVKAKIYFRDIVGQVAHVCQSCFRQHGRNGP